jgi:hypothetical protein
MAAVIVGFLDLVVAMSHGQSPNKLPSSALQAGSLKPPATGKIDVAVLISEGADVMMDIAGPREIFSDAALTTKGKPWHVADGDDM